MSGGAVPNCTCTVATPPASEVSVTLTLPSLNVRPTPSGASAKPPREPGVVSISSDWCMTFGSLPIRIIAPPVAGSFAPKVSNAPPAARRSM